MVALEGQGQDELFGVLSGSRRPSGGTLEVDGREVHFDHPADAIRAGLVYVPGDRVEALLMQRSGAREHRAALLRAPAGWGPIDMRRREGARRPRDRAAPDRYPRAARGAAPLRRQPAEGDDRALDRRRRATLLCFDPTRGIDIRTKREIYRLLRELAAAGAAVLLYTSELEEVQLACDRAVVIFGGRVVDEMPARDRGRAGADARGLWPARERAGAATGC